MGGFFRREIRSAGGPRGPEDPGRRSRRAACCRGSAPCRSADGAGRHRPGSRIRRARRRHLGGALRRFQARRRRQACRRPRPSTITPAGGAVARWSTSSFNRAKHDALPAAFRAALRDGGAVDPSRRSSASYDAANPGALKRAGDRRGPSCAPSPRTCWKPPSRPSNEVYREISDANPAVQVHARCRHGVPGGPISVVAGQRIHVRQFHDSPARQAAERPSRAPVVTCGSTRVGDRATRAEPPRDGLAPQGAPRRITSASARCR